MSTRVDQLKHVTQRLRIFISSPSDVKASREMAALTIERLAQDYARTFRIEPYLWEYEAMIASGHFQDSIELPSEFDIVVLILWSRLGTSLPQKTALREYRGIDGRSPLTGTEWEFEEALAGAQKRGVPDLLVYRSVKPASISMRDAARRKDELLQFQALERFWERHFVNHGVFLGAYTSFSSDLEFVKLLEAHLRKVIERRIASSHANTAATKTWLKAPFRGLEAYEFEHAPIYFGQDEALSKAMLQLSERADTDGAFLLVLGASGSGKSSLVKAGIAPKLFVPRRIPGVCFLRWAIFRPSDAGDGEDVFDALARRLTTQLSPIEGMCELLGSNQTATSLAAHLRHSADAPAYPIGLTLGHIGEQARLDGRMLDFESGKLLLIVDQLEELFTSERCDAGERRKFIALLGGLARSKVVWVIATMRRDFWHSAEETPELLRLADGIGRLELPPPTPLQQSQMIQRPAAAAGIQFESHSVTGVALNDAIAEEFALEPGAIPLLSYLLDQLYRLDVTESGGNTLTYASYEQLGRLDGAIATQAEAVLGRCAAEERSALGSILFSLVQFSSLEKDSERVVARRVPLASFPLGTPQRRLVEALLDSDARLLVSDADRGSEPMVRVAHESLIARWAVARNFLTDNAAALRVRRRLEERRALWLAQYGDAAPQRGHNIWGTFRGKEPGLLTDIDLTDGRRLLREHAADIDPQLAAFIERSIADNHRLRNRSIRALAVVASSVTLLAIAASITGWIASQRQREAEAQRELTLQAQSRLLTESAAQRLRGNDVADAQNIVLEVLGRRGNSAIDRAAAVSVFQEARAADFQLMALGVPAAASSAIYSPDGTRILSTARDRTARIWDARTGVPLAVLGPDKVALSAAYAPDGTRFVSPSGDMTARVWDAVTGSELSVLSGHAASVRSANYSPDGAHIVTSSFDKTARIWDAQSGAPITVLSGHTDRVQDAVYSPDGRHIVTASFDNTARIWDAQTGAQMTAPLIHGDTVMSAMYSPDGSRIVTASQDNTAAVWDSRSGRRLMTLSGHTERVMWASYSPDGRRIVTASVDNTARVWDAASGAQLAILSGHSDRVISAMFSPDSSRIVTGSGDRSIRVWDAASLTQLAVFSGHTGRVITAAFSPDATRIVTTSFDHTARVWDARSGSLLGILAGLGTEVIGATYSPDATRILITTVFNRSLWDAASLIRLGTVEDPGKVLNSATYSADGRQIVTASRDKTARIWDVASQKLLMTLSGHSEEVTYAVFSPDGARVVTSSDDKTARIWDAKNGNQIALLAGHTGHVETAMFSADGARVVTASADKTVRVWDSKSGELLNILYGHNESVNAAVFSNDGAHIVSASDDRTARIWNALTGDQLAVLLGHTDNVEWVAYSPDSKRIVTASSDKTARIWDTSVPAGIEAQIAWQSAAVVDPLSSVQRQHFGLEGSSRPVPAAWRRATECDRLAAAIYDPDRLAAGVLQADISAVTARSACSTSEVSQSPRAHYQLGRALVAAHDEQGAEAQFEHAAAAGYRAARIDLALLLSQKSNAGEDIERAATLLERAWSSGVQIAAFELGQLYEHAPGMDREKAWPWYQKGADLREPNAMSRLAKREETSALDEHSRQLQDAKLLRAFSYYAMAAAAAGEEGWPDESWSTWRFRRASLARILARDGLMQQVADCYKAIEKPPQKH